MNKIFILTAIIFSLFFAQDSFAKVKKIKCNKPIYFFENVNKREYFYYLDESLQNQYELKKYYPELGFISFNYEVKRNKPEIVALNLKQFGRDVFLFIDISKSNTKLEQKIYEDLKKHSTNSYLIRDDYFCKELTKDVNLITSSPRCWWLPAP